MTDLLYRGFIYINVKRVIRVQTPISSIKGIILMSPKKQNTLEKIKLNILLVLGELCNWLASPGCILVVLLLSIYYCSIYIVLYMLVLFILSLKLWY